MSAPNPDDPLDTTIADHWLKDEPAALELATQWTQRFALKDGGEGKQ